MYLGSGILCALAAAVLVCSCCLSAIFPEPVVTPVLTPTPTAVPTTESPVSTVMVSQMALQATDIPADYILKDRSDITYTEVGQIAHDLGWRAGYQVTYYRINQEKYDLTGLRQTISQYTLKNMNMVFTIEKEAVTTQDPATVQVYELPCPTFGDRTFAYREIPNQSAPSSATYTIFFIKKDVYEELTMCGTTTDYETLKPLAQAAAEKIR